MSSPLPGLRWRGQSCHDGRMIRPLAPLSALFLSALAASSAVCAQMAPAAAPAVSPAQQDAALSAFFARYDQATLARSPEALSLIHI